jgi:hypothetical protein
MSTSNSLGVHDDFVSVSLRIHIGSRRFHFEFTSNSLRLVFTSITDRFHFDVTSMSLGLTVGTCFVFLCTQNANVVGHSAGPWGRISLCWAMGSQINLVSGGRAVGPWMKWYLRVDPKQGLGQLPPV